MTEQNLYFILNPAIGIIKIGIAGDVNERRHSLQMACGVELTVLAIGMGCAHFERELHDSFGADRLMGEWFVPSDELLMLAASVAACEAPAKTLFPEYLQANAGRIAHWRKTREKALAAAKADVNEARQAEKEARDRLKAEIERQVKAREERAEKRKLARHEAERKRVEAEREAWKTKTPDLVERVMGGKEANLAEERRALIASSQRARNAAMIGVTHEDPPNATR